MNSDTASLCFEKTIANWDEALPLGNPKYGDEKSPRKRHLPPKPFSHLKILITSCERMHRHIKK